MSLTGATDRNHYEVLGLPSPLSGRFPSPLEIKAAYRRSLLKHHPDKLDHGAARSRHTGSGASVDAIVNAFKVLGSQSARAEYDRSLLLRSQARDSPASKLAQSGPEHAGVEVVDLEDMVYDEQSSTWHRSCRCGDTQGYLVTESELAEEAEIGFILIGCHGCSLCISVSFQATPEDEASPTEVNDGS